MEQRTCETAVVLIARDASAEVSECIFRRGLLVTPHDGDAAVHDREAVRLGIELELNRNTAPFNIYGLPTISIPCGFTSSELPIGMLVSGPRFGEARVLALAHAYEQATDWHTRRSHAG